MQTLADLIETIDDIVESYKAHGKNPEDIRLVAAIQPSYPLAVSATGIFAPLKSATPWNRSYLTGDGTCPHCGEPIGENFATIWDDDRDKEVGICADCHDTKDEDGTSVVWITTGSHPHGLNPYAPHRVYSEETE